MFANPALRQESVACEEVWTVRSHCGDGARWRTVAGSRTDLARITVARYEQCHGVGDGAAAISPAVRGACRGHSVLRGHAVLRHERPIGCDRCGGGDSSGRRFHRRASSVACAHAARVTGGVAPRFLRPTASWPVPPRVLHSPARSIRGRRPRGRGGCPRREARASASRAVAARSVRDPRGACGRGAARWRAGRDRHVQVATPGASPRCGCRDPDRHNARRSDRGARSGI